MQPIKNSEEPFFPPKPPGEEVFGVTVRLHQWLWDKLEKIAKAEDHSRNDVIERLLTLGVAGYEQTFGKIR